MSETSRRDRICSAIETRHLLRFVYSDDRIRVVEPHLVGENTAHNDTLVAWLVRGEVVDAGYAPGWRSYLLRGISSLEVLDEAFHHARATYRPNDSRMLQIYCSIAPTPDKA
jgi:GH35 family endo-1,4-beta-xylanase